VEAGNRQLLAEVVGHRLAEVRRAADSPSNRSPIAWASAKGRISEIERGKISGQDVLTRYATALGGRLHLQLLDAGHSELIGGAA
jgi:hypothetical protein